MIDAAGDWNGVCACGKAAMDGVRCSLGATHQPRQPLPWAIPSIPAATAGAVVSVDHEHGTMGVVWSDGDGGAITYPVDATYLRKAWPWE